MGLVTHVLSALAELIWAFAGALCCAAGAYFGMKNVPCPKNAKLASIFISAVVGAVITGVTAISNHVRSDSGSWVSHVEVCATVALLSGVGLGAILRLVFRHDRYGGKTVLVCPTPPSNDSTLSSQSHAPPPGFNQYRRGSTHFMYDHNAVSHNHQGHLNDNLTLGNVTKHFEHTSASPGPSILQQQQQQARLGRRLSLSPGNALT